MTKNIDTACKESDVKHTNASFAQNHKFDIFELPLNL